MLHLVTDIVLWLLHGVFNVSACVGSHLWLMLSTGLPPLVTSISHFLESSMHVIVPRFLYVSTIFYRDVVDCIAAIVIVCGQIVKATARGVYAHVVSLMTQLYTLLPAGVHLVSSMTVEIMWDCFGAAAFVSRAFVFLIFVVKLIVDCIVQSCVDVVVTLMTTLFRLLDVMLTGVIVSVSWSFDFMTAVVILLLRSFLWITVTLQHFLALLLHMCDKWTWVVLLVSVLTVVMWWLFPDWRDALRDVCEWLNVLLRSSRLWLISSVQRLRRDGCEWLNVLFRSGGLRLRSSVQRFRRGFGCERLIVFLHSGRRWLTSSVQHFRRGFGCERLNVFLQSGRRRLTSSVQRFRRALRTAREDHTELAHTVADLENEQRGTDGEAMGDFDRRLCVVCFDGERDTVLFPCRHLSLCGNCAGRVMRDQGRCPVCREMVRTTEMVFL